MRVAFKHPEAGASQPGVGGAAAWLVEATQLLWKRAGASRLCSAERQMELVETLALGGRKQLLLVRCGGESFLVGIGTESVQTIVRVAPHTIANGAEEVSRCF